MPAASPRILLVDDDESFRELLVFILYRFRSHLQVTEAANGHDAYTRYQEAGADALITDDHMPLMPGVALIRRVRQMGSTIPILLWSMDAHLHPALVDDPFTQVMLRPASLEHLLQAVDAVLAR